MQQVQHILDVVSLKLCGITIFGGILLNIIPSGFLGFLTGLAAVSTIVYNGYRTWKEYKARQK